MIFRLLRATGTVALGIIQPPYKNAARTARTMPKSYDSATVELAMTLSTLAYVDEGRTATQQQMIGEINAGLEEAGYPTWAGRRTESDPCGLTGARDWLVQRRGRQERLDCSQQLADVYRFRDVGGASTFQSLGFRRGMARGGPRDYQGR
jgi:hypothetical protein